MLSRLLRRLQGRPMLSHAYAPDGGGVEAEDTPGRVERQGETEAASTPLPAHVLDPTDLETRGLCWLLGVPRTAADDAAATQALAYLEPLARRLDPRRLPRLPVLVPQLLAALRRDDTGAQGLAALLARDPTLAGDVMRVANSAFYRRAMPATGLVQAVSLLGADGLRHVVLTSVMRPILRPDARSATASRLWDLAEARTGLCARIAPGRHDIAEAQLAAVVASTGTGALLGMAPAVLIAPAASSRVFAEGLRTLARDVTVRAAMHWHLPEAVVLGLQEPAGATGLGAVLRTGERLALGHMLARDGALAPDETVCGGDGMVGDAAEHADLLATLAADTADALVETAA